MVYWIIFGIAIVCFVGTIAWMLRWHDASWNEEGQRRAFLWSKRGSGGGR